MEFSIPVEFLGQDADAHGNVRPAVLLDRLEEAGVREMAAYPPSNDELFAAGLTFLLARLSIRFFGDVRPGCAEARSFPTESHGYLYNRAYRLVQDGKTVALATSVWALLDRDTRRPTRVGDHGEIGGPICPAPKTGLPARALFPKGLVLTELCRRTVFRSDTDRNGHLNNTKSLNFFCDALPTDLPLRGAVLSFVRESPLGETLTLVGAEQDGTWYMKALGADGQPNCEAILFF